jgi:hypothetical protein
MKKSLFFALALTAAVVSCKKEEVVNEKTEKAQTNSSAESDDAVHHTCYEYAGARDTVRMNIVEQDKAVNGSLAYEYFEKDKNSGIVEGVVKGDTLVLNYTFMSEGTNSKRQVVFLKKGDALVEGYGDTFEKDGAVLYKDLKKLKFDEKFPLKKTDCKEK